MATLEDRLSEFLKQPDTSINAAERQFIDDIRRARASGVGYGWMQQVIEWEWQSVSRIAFGPEYYRTQINDLERKLKKATGKGVS